MGANSKYIISINNEKINIFIFENNKLKNICVRRFNFKNQKIEMSKIYNNIFLTVSRGAINLFEISKSNNNYKLENKLTIETDDTIEFAKFSEYDEKIIGAVTNDNLVRLWNIDSNFNYIKIIPKCRFVTNLCFNKNKNVLIIQGYYLDNSYEIYIYDLLYGINIKNIIKRNTYDFIYELSEKDFNKILLVNQENIEFMDVTRNEIYDKIKLNLKNEIDYVCFYKSINLIILFSRDSVIIEDINEKKNLFSEKHNDFANIFTDYCEKKDDKLYIYILRLPYIETFSLKLKNKNDIIYPKIESKILFTKPFKKIYTKPNFDFANALIKPNNIKKKNYLDIDEIISALHNNYSLSLEDKKQNVKDKINDYKNNDTFHNRYIFLLKLLIQDNTNKDLLKLYLELLQDNDEFFKKEYKNLENFETEYSKYKSVFNQSEIKEYFDLEKESEKNEFFKFLEIIKLGKDYSDIIKEFEDDYLGIFNQGIKYDNQELFWFKNKALLVYAILKMTSDEKKLMKSCVDKIIEKKLFDDPIIYKNYKYIALLMFLMIKPLKENDCIDNLNLIESLLKDNTENININENKILNSNNNIKVIDYKQAYDAYNKSIHIDKIKNFLKKIFCSNVIKEAFQILYPYYINFPFPTEKDAEKYINNYINFVVFQKHKSNGMTDKFSLDTFIFLKQRNMIIYNIYDDKLKELIEKILYTAGIVKTNCHELNHNFYNMFYYHENGNIPLKTPRKEGLEIREGGREMEKILFGNILSRINIKEALYILNEDNYKKNIFQFKKDFEALYSSEENKDDCKITGEFCEYNNLPDNVLDETSKLLIYETLEDSVENIYIESSDNDDIIGID